MSFPNRSEKLPARPLRFKRLQLPARRICKATSLTATLRSLRLHGGSFCSSHISMGAERRPQAQLTQLFGHMPPAMMPSSSLDGFKRSFGCSPHAQATAGAIRPSGSFRLSERAFHESRLTSLQRPKSCVGKITRVAAQLPRLRIPRQVTWPSEMPQDQSAAREHNPPSLRATILRTAMVAASFGVAFNRRRGRLSP